VYTEETSFIVPHTKKLSLKKKDLSVFLFFILAKAVCTKKITQKGHAGLNLESESIVKGQSQSGAPTMEEVSEVDTDNQQPTQNNRHPTTTRNQQ
jgi:hypothetical protein